MVIEIEQGILYLINREEVVYGQSFDVEILDEEIASRFI
jgi:hypothetical protein